MKRRITILLSLILSLTATAFSQKTESPANVAKAFLESLAGQEIEKAREAVDEKFTGNIRDRLKLNAAFFKNRELKFIEVSSEKVDEQSAHIEIKLTDKRKNETECRMIFYKNPGSREWKIIYWAFAVVLPEPADIPRSNQPKTKIPILTPPRFTDPPVLNPDSPRNGD
jgi:hypothetical protein